MKTENVHENIKKIPCSGDDTASSHPLIYLDLTKKDQVTCPYCGKVFSNKSKINE